MIKKLLGDKTRLLSSIVLILATVPTFVITAYAHEIGRYVGVALAALLGMRGLYEIYCSFKIDKYVSIIMSLVVVPVILFGWSDFRAIVDSPKAPLSVLMHWVLQDWRIYVAIAIFTTLPFLLDFKYIKNQKNILISHLILIIVTIVAALFIKQIWTIAANSFWKFCYFVLIAAIADTFAYLGGLHFGKKWFNGAKFAPRLSPKKTWAGFVIGTISAAIFAILAGYFTHVWKVNDNATQEITVAVVGGLLLAFVAPYGDLAYSGIKRWNGIKDFSNLIPGHGGVYDRFDSLSVIVFVASVIFVNQ